MLSIKDKDGDFILDSGATVYTCSNKAYFTDLKLVDSTLRQGNNDKNAIKASGIGNVRIRFKSTN